MAFRMVKLTGKKTGAYFARKVIPRTSALNTGRFTATAPRNCSAFPRESRNGAALDHG
jgi:hypothetical protein